MHCQAIQFETTMNLGPADVVFCVVVTMWRPRTILHWSMSTWDVPVRNKIGYGVVSRLVFEISKFKNLAFTHCCSEKPFDSISVIRQSFISIFSQPTKLAIFDPFC